MTVKVGRPSCVEIDHNHEDDEIDIEFFDENGLVVCGASILPSGKVVAFVLSPENKPLSAGSYEVPK